MQWRGFAIMGKTRVMTRERARPWRGPRRPNSPLRLSLDTFDPAFGIRVVAGTTVRFHRFLGNGFVVDVPGVGKARLTLSEVAQLLAERVVSLYRRDETGIAPAMQAQAQFRSDPHWRDLLLFYEYFHAETGQGLGACHQTGWTGLIANLLLRNC